MAIFFWEHRKKNLFNIVKLFIEIRSPIFFGPSSRGRQNESSAHNIFSKRDFQLFFRNSHFQRLPVFKRVTVCWPLSWSDVSLNRQPSWLKLFPKITNIIIAPWNCHIRVRQKDESLSGSELVLILIDSSRLSVPLSEIFFFYLKVDGGKFGYKSCVEAKICYRSLRIREKKPLSFPIVSCWKQSNSLLHRLAKTLQAFS